jgi:hypothetical protein
MSAGSMKHEAGSRRKMALQTAMWFLFAFCFLLFFQQVYPEQSIDIEHLKKNYKLDAGALLYFRKQK